MKCQVLFSRRYKKNIISLPSAEFALSIIIMAAADDIFIFFLFFREKMRSLILSEK